MIYLYKYNNSSINKFIGYGTLIRAYVDFLRAKLSYHRHHPEFNGNFDYEDYISLKNVDDPNEGYVIFCYSNLVCFKWFVFFFLFFS